MVSGNWGILFLMDGWMSSAGGIQTVNRNLACALAKRYEQLDVICLVPHADQTEKDDAFNHNVRLISGEVADDWASAFISKELETLDRDRIIGIVGHSKYSGREAA